MTFVSSVYANDDNVIGKCRGDLWRPCYIGDLYEYGLTIDKEINCIGFLYDAVLVDKYVIIPNHIHMINFLCKDIGRPQVAPTITRIIRQFKKL